LIFQLVAQLLRKECPLACAEGRVRQQGGYEIDEMLFVATPSRHPVPPVSLL
jgi:hypothetical protein